MFVRFCIFRNCAKKLFFCKYWTKSQRFIFFLLQTLCSEPGGHPADMQISEAAGGAPLPGTEPCRFPKLEECAHFHYERVQLPPALQVALQTNMDQSLHSQHSKYIIMILAKNLILYLYTLLLLFHVAFSKSAHFVLPIPT